VADAPVDLLQRVPLFAGLRKRELESLARGGELNRASTLLTRAEETWGAVRRALEAVRAAGEAR
jgi:hypothetical protein